MRFYRNVIILAVVLITLIGVYLYLQNQDTAKSQKDKVLVKSFDKNSIVQIDMQNNHGLISLIKNGAEWKMLKPKEYKLDKVLTDSFVNKIYDLKAEDIIEENTQNFEKYGLKNPKSTVVVKTSGGKTSTFMLGDETPVEEGYYLRMSEMNTVYRVDTYTAGDFLRSVNEFIKK